MPEPADNVPNEYPDPLPIRSCPLVGMDESPVPPIETGNGTFPPPPFANDAI